MAVVLAGDEQVALAGPVEDPLPGLLLRQPVELAGVRVHAPVGADHGRLGQPVVAADREVGRVVAGRDLQRAGAELGLDALVGDDRHAPLDERDDRLLADEILVALVVGVHRDGDVAEDRRGAHRRDRDGAAPVRERVPDRRQRVVDVGVDQLEVGQRRVVERAPVDDPVVPVDPALLVQVHEEADDRARVLRVHREALSPVVERGADAPELGHDLAAVLVEPLPDERHERLAPHLLPCRPALAREELFDRRLRRDAGVVVARLEEHVVALHPPRPAHDVAHGELQRVADVQLAGHVGRRVRVDVRRARRVDVGGVQAFGFPGLLPALLDAVGRVERVHG